MISECVKLAASWYTTGFIARFDWNLCECCNFTQLRLYKNPFAFANFQPNFHPIYNDLFFNRNTPWPSQSDGQIVFSTWQLVFDLPIADALQWYRGITDWPRNVEQFVLFAQMCDSGTWMMSKMTEVTFDFPRFTFPPSTAGYSSPNPPA